MSLAFTNIIGSRFISFVPKLPSFSFCKHTIPTAQTAILHSSTFFQKTAFMALPVNSSFSLTTHRFFFSEPLKISRSLYPSYSYIKNYLEHHKLTGDSVLIRHSNILNAVALNYADTPIKNQGVEIGITLLITENWPNCPSPTAVLLASHIARALAECCTEWRKEKGVI